MRYLLRVNHTNEYAEHHLYAVVDVDRDLARRVIERKRWTQALSRADGSFRELAYCDYSAEWYDSVDLDGLVKKGRLTAEERENFDAEGICVLSDDAELGDESAASNNRMILCRFGVAWAGRGKHDSDEFSAKVISFDVFEEVIAQESSAAISSSPSL